MLTLHLPKSAYDNRTETELNSANKIKLSSCIWDLEIKKSIKCKNQNSVWEILMTNYTKPYTHVYGVFKVNF